jgi:NAD(P)-dependent dehydrogenase (short-subunit alcohol dehydrogenase family)
LKETYDQLDGAGHKYIVADLVVPDDLTKLVDEVENLNGLVLCAGKGVTVPIPFATPDKFKDIFELNLFSPIELLRLLFKKKKLLKESSTVFVSSIGGIYSINYANGVYGASKAAVSSIMKFCAKEFAVKGIRVNSVNPGRVETKMINMETFTQEQKETDIQQYPLKRYGRPEEIAYAVIFLLSDASGWITGLELVIDGGMTI